jgi:hypothetical protein
LLTSFGGASTLTTRLFDVVGYEVVAAMVAVCWLALAGGGAPMKMQFLVNLTFGLDGHNDTLRSEETDCGQVGIYLAVFKVS